LILILKHKSIRFEAKAQISYLASNAAKPKVKGIDGKSLEQWII